MGGGGGGGTPTGACTGGGGGEGGGGEDVNALASFRCRLCFERNASNTAMSGSGMNDCISERRDEDF